jgi:hypothetical protein
MKNPRVCKIKKNIEKGESVPNFTKDCSAGQYFEREMIDKGHHIDPNGLVDMPEFRVDMKSRKLRSNASHTVGSMTISNIINTKNWEDTRFYHKTQNQNQITWDSDFLEVTDVKLVDMDIDIIQQNLREGYTDVREQLESKIKSKDVLPKEIKSKNGWVVLDGYGHSNSYRMRIPNTAMKKIKNIAATRDTFKQHFTIL